MVLEQDDENSGSHILHWTASICTYYWVILCYSPVTVVENTQPPANIIFRFRVDWPWQTMGLWVAMSGLACGWISYGGAMSLLLLCRRCCAHKDRPEEGHQLHVGLRSPFLLLELPAWDALRLNSCPPEPLPVVFPLTLTVSWLKPFWFLCSSAARQVVRCFLVGKGRSLLRVKWWQNKRI